MEHNCFLKPSASSASGLEGPNFLEENVAQIHKQLLLELIKPPVQFIQEALTEQLSFTTSSHQQYHPTEPNCWRWLLQCVDCQAQVLTKYGRSDDEALEDSKQMGWRKATTKSWARSTRCPVCQKKAFSDGSNQLA